MEHDLSNNNLYHKLDDLSRSLINRISDIIFEIVKKEDIVSSILEENWDEEHEWISYIICVNMKPAKTLGLNLKFINYCIKNELFDILTSDRITFRFE